MTKKSLKINFSVIFFGYCVGIMDIPTGFLLFPRSYTYGEILNRSYILMLGAIIIDISRMLLLTWVVIVTRSTRARKKEVKIIEKETQ